ncbi:MAG: ABC transporter permease [Acidimicrobiales bacterium]|jgi:ABC-2 type transport system permease protein
MTDLQSEAGPGQSESDPTRSGSGRGADTLGTSALAERQRELAERMARAAERGIKPTREIAARVSVWRRLGEVWRSRELFGFLVRKEIKVKYKNSVLGFLWSMLNPAMNLAVFYVLFTFFLPNGIPNFVIYMFSAILVWNLFLTAVLTGTSTIVNNGGIVKKVAFPREVLSFAAVGSAFMFFLFQSIVLVGFMVVFWHRPAWGDMWLLIPALAAIVVLASALSVFLSAVNVYLRDTMHLVEVILNAWFWATPAIYRFAQAATELRRHHILWLYFLDPVVPVVMTFQRVFYAVPIARSTIKPHPLEPMLATYGTHWYLLADLAVLGISLVLLLGALVVFGRLEGNFAEEL